jgi:hypothetical protein
MKKEDQILTYAQARDLKWFCSNCTGLRSEFYPLLDKMTSFQEKLDRLEKTAVLIEKFLKDCGESNPINKEVIARVPGHGDIRQS